MSYENGCGFKANQKEMARRQKSHLDVGEGAKFHKNRNTENKFANKVRLFWARFTGFFFTVQMQILHNLHNFIHRKNTKSRGSSFSGQLVNCVYFDLFLYN